MSEIHTEGQFKNIDNKISKLLTVKGRFTKDFQKASRTQPRAGFMVSPLGAEEANIQKLLKELIDQSTESYGKEGKKIEIKEVNFSKELELAFARGGKSRTGMVRYVKEPGRSMEIGLTVDELNEVFKGHQDKLQLYFVDLVATPWVFEGQDKDAVRAGVTFYLKRLQGAPAAADQKS